MADVSPDRWEQIENIFHAALRRDADTREAFLDQACAGDAVLRAEVAALLVSHQQGGPLSAIDDDTIVDPPVQVDQYRIIRPLGEGGMGSVYLAERKGADFTQMVALKLMRTGISDRRVEARLRAEQGILARLEHPGIARLIDGGTTAAGQPYYAMEYVEGLNIVLYSDRNRLSVQERLQLFLLVCDPVRYAHQQLVVHRDIKPNNILVTKDGLPKLLDFGIAKVIDPTRDLQKATKTGAWFTPAYAAPEQVMGQEVNTLSDVYALGVLLYELLTGRLPYTVDAQTPEEIQEIVGHRMPERPSAVVSRTMAFMVKDGSAGVHTPEHISSARKTTPERLRRLITGDLDAIVLKALAKKPANRYASVDQFAEDLRRYLDGRPVLARPHGASYKASKFIARHRTSLAAGAAVIVVLVAYGGTVTLQNRQVRRALEQARIEANRASQLTELLLGLFENPTSGGAAGDLGAARELLERGHARAEAMEGRPEAQAQMLAALGRVHSHLGEYDQAAPELERALELRRQVHGDRHLTVADDLVALAEVYRLMGRYIEAEAAVREALATQRSIVGDENARVAQTLNELSLVLRDAGDYAAAEPPAREALAMRRRLLGEDHPDVAESVNYLAALLRRMGDYDAAEPLYRQALAMRRRIYSGDHPLLAETINNLALQLHQQGNSEEAEPLYREAVAMYVKLFGREHPFVATVTTNLANVLVELDELGEAERLCAEALDVQRRSYGDEHPQIAISLNAMAGLRHRQGRLTEAEEYYRTGLAMRRRLLGDEHPRVVLNLANLAGVLRDQGELDEAAMHAREAVRIGRRVLGDRHPDTAAALTEMGAALRALGDYAGAEPPLRDAMDIRRELLGDDNRFVAATAQELVTLYESWGRPAQADLYRTYTGGS